MERADKALGDDLMSQSNTYKALALGNGITSIESLENADTDLVGIMSRTEYSIEEEVAGEVTARDKGEEVTDYTMNYKLDRDNFSGIYQISEEKNFQVYYYNDQMERADKALGDDLMSQSNTYKALALGNGITSIESLENADTDLTGIMSRTEYSIEEEIAGLITSREKGEEVTDYTMNYKLDRDSDTGIYTHSEEKNFQVYYYSGQVVRADKASGDDLMSQSNTNKALALWHGISSIESLERADTDLTGIMSRTEYSIEEEVAGKMVSRDKGEEVTDYTMNYKLERNSGSGVYTQSREKNFQVYYYSGQLVRADKALGDDLMSQSNTYKALALGHGISSIESLESADTDLSGLMSRTEYSIKEEIAGETVSREKGEEVTDYTMNYKLDRDSGSGIYGNSEEKNFQVYYYSDQLVRSDNALFALTSWSL